MSDIETVVAHMKAAHEAKRRRPIRRRKNIGNIYGILSGALKAGIYAPGDEIDTQDIANMIKEAGYQKGEDLLGKWFNRDDDRCDDMGPTKSIGDIVGGHGLKLQKKSKNRDRIYIFPTQLPEVEGDSVYAEAVYS